MSKLDELKELNAEKKALNEKAKALREELNEGKEERKTAKKAQATSRKNVASQKSTLAKLTAAIYPTFSKGSVEELNQMADDIMEAATELSGSVRQFAEAAEQLEDL